MQLNRFQFVNETKMPHNTNISQNHVNPGLKAGEIAVPS